MKDELSTAHLIFVSPGGEELRDFHTTLRGLDLRRAIINSAKSCGAGKVIVRMDGEVTIYKVEIFVDLKEI